MKRISIRKLILVLVSFYCSLLLSVTSCQSDSQPFRETGTHWTVGFAKMAIAPDDVNSKPYYIAGYGADKPATGILDPQFIRAVWIDDNSRRGGMVMVSIDCIGLSRSDVERVRKDLRSFQRESGCRSINIFSTHTHAGVDTLGIWGPVLYSGKDDVFMDRLRNGTVETVKNAWRTRKDGILFAGSTEIDGLLNDSRDPQVYSEKLTRIRFVPDDGSQGLQIIHFGAHPEALRSANTLISADFPAYMGKRITEITGDDFIYFTGAIGGLISTRRQNDSSGTQLDVYESTRKTGYLLADAALAITEEQRLTASLNIKTEIFRTPMENPVFLVAKFFGVLDTNAVRGGGQFGKAIETEVSYAEIGEIKAVFVPGELFPELAYGENESFEGSYPSADNPELFKKTIGSEDFLVFGLGNDEIGYIIPPNDFILDEKYPYINEGTDKFGNDHYEETKSLGPQTAPNLAEALQKILHDIQGQ